MPDKAKNETSAVKGFSRFAHTYNTYNMIQAQVAQTLVNGIERKDYGTIIDIGCGSGAVYANLKKRGIAFDRFVAMDLSQKMLELHPSDMHVVKICSDFNSPRRLENYCGDCDTLILSSSALQWSANLDQTFSWLSKCAYQSRFAIFTSNTFRTLHQTAGISSPIYSEEVLKQSIEKYYKADFRTEVYALEFASTKEMFRYIQKSGVGGGERQMGYKQMKRVMEEYPLDYLEFEVLFVEATSLLDCV